MQKKKTVQRLLAGVRPSVCSAKHAKELKDSLHLRRLSLSG